MLGGAEAALPLGLSVAKPPKDCRSESEARSSPTLPNEPYEA